MDPPSVDGNQMLQDSSYLQDVLPYASELAPVSQASFPQEFVSAAPAPKPVQADLYDLIVKSFHIGFKKNENIKNPQQLLVDDTFYVQPKKLFAFHLKGVPDGLTPQILVYATLADEERRGQMVEKCGKHGKEGSIISTGDSNLWASFFCSGVNAWCLQYYYPTGKPAAISLGFSCSSSCFSRSGFILHVGLLFEGGVPIFAQHKVKVCSNPARDSGLMKSKLVSGLFNAAIPTVPTTSRKRLQPSSSESAAKKSSAEADDQLIAEPSNGVYTITTYGYENFKRLAEQNALLITKNKYTFKNVPDSGICNSQIQPTDEIGEWLVSLKQAKYKSWFQVKNYATMAQISRSYHANFFEKLHFGVNNMASLPPIPPEVCEILHRSFLYWQIPRLYERLTKMSSEATAV
jgi:hypothetical protein